MFEAALHNLTSSLGLAFFFASLAHFLVLIGEQRFGGFQSGFVIEPAVIHCMAQHFFRVIEKLVVRARRKRISAGGWISLRLKRFEPRQMLQHVGMFFEPRTGLRRSFFRAASGNGSIFFRKPLQAGLRIEALLFC